MDAETEAAMLEQTLQDQEDGYQTELARLKEHMEMQKVWNYLNPFMQGASIPVSHPSVHQFVRLLHFWKDFYYWEIMGWTSGYLEIMETSRAKHLIQDLIISLLFNPNTHSLLHLLFTL